MSRKIIDLIKDVRHITYSFEVIPGITEDFLENLNFEPLFISITWHAQTHKYTDLNIAPLKLANNLKNKDKNVLLHLSCTNMKKDFVDVLLKWLQDKGLCNLFIILGENYDCTVSDFKSSQELIFYIRQCTGNYFCIGVAGFPDRDDKMFHLKEKVESGADFIITQAFFDDNVYGTFLNKCREMDINVPVIPGIFPFETKKELEGFIKRCDVHLPIVEVAHESGINVIAKIIHKIVTKSYENNFHLFTLNKIQRSLKLMNSVETLIR